MECFIVNIDGIKGRLDAFFYSRVFRKLDTLKNVGLIEFKELIESITKGETPLWRGDSYLSKGIAFFKMQNISETGIKGEVAYISEEVHHRMKRSQLSGGELLYTMAGTVGIAMCFPENFGEANINQALAKIILKEGLNKKYIEHILNSNFCKLQAKRFLTISAQPNINFEQIKSIKLPFLSLEMQKHIVDFMQYAYEQKNQKEQEAKRLLDSIDDYVLDELGIELPELKNKQCYPVDIKNTNKRLNPFYYQPKFQNLEIALKNSKYKTEPLKRFITRIHYGVSIKNVYVDEGIPLIRICNLKPNKIDLTDMVKLSEITRKAIGNGFVYKNDFLISRSGSVGIVAVVPEEADGFAFGSFIIKFCLSDEINKEFVAVWLNNKLSQLFIQREKIGAVQGNITIGTIEGLKIPLPSLSIQNKIAEEVKRRMSEAKRLRAESQTLIEQAKQKVEEIISGKTS